jgi:hypothetical protein
VLEPPPLAAQVLEHQPLERSRQPAPHARGIRRPTLERDDARVLRQVLGHLLVGDQLARQRAQPSQVRQQMLGIAARRAIKGGCHALRSARPTASMRRAAFE